MKIQKINRIIHSVMCAMNLGAVFYALMSWSIGTPFYGFLRQMSLAFGWPLLLMRVFYLQYIIFGCVAVFTIMGYVKNNKEELQ